MNRLKPLIIRDTEIRVPIIQGGMGVAVSTDKLAASVSSEGALGIIASVGLGVLDEYTDFKESNKQALAEFIRKAKEKTKNPVGINLMIAASDWKELAETGSDEKIDFIITSTALPMGLPGHVDTAYTKLIPKISSDRVAYIICRQWDRKYNILPDAFVVEGPLSGGHQGFSFEELADPGSCRVEDILNSVKKVIRPFEDKYKKNIPLIAAGGIFTGKDIAYHIKNRADGVLLGSRFVCTKECDVADDFKNAYIKSTASDIAIIMSPVGLPVRVLKNSFYNRIINNNEKQKIKCTFNCLKTCDPGKVLFCIAKALIAAKKGDMDNALILCSATTPRVNKIMSVHDLLNSLINEAENC